jgi:hypothetical protein
VTRTGRQDTKHNACVPAQHGVLLAWEIVFALERYTARQDAQ